MLPSITARRSPGTDAHEIACNFNSVRTGNSAAVERSALRVGGEASGEIAGVFFAAGDVFGGAPFPGGAEDRGVFCGGATAAGGGCDATVSLLSDGGGV
jgi:hypothetical protein